MTASILDRRTLRFLDPDLELAYQQETIDQVRRETLVVGPISIVLWLIAGVLLPTFTPIPASVSTPIVVFMAIVLLVATIPIRRMRNLDDLTRIVVPLNLLTAAAILTLAAQAGQFERYAGPAILLQSIFIVIGARRFVLALVLLSIEAVLLASVAWAIGVLGTRRRSLPGRLHAGAHRRDHLRPRNGGPDAGIRAGSSRHCTPRSTGSFTSTSRPTSPPHSSPNRVDPNWAVSWSR